MRQFYIAFSNRHALSDQLSWTHYRMLLKVEDENARNFYLEECEKSNWSTRQLERQINSFYYQRLLSSQDEDSVRNEIQSLEKGIDAKDIIRDPYVLEFLGLEQTPNLYEKDIEQGLINHLQKSLLELGRGFSFVARQKRISFDGEHYYIDLVFYNYILKCFVIIDLKVGKLTHQDFGQMQMYVNYYTRELMNEGDNLPIGIVLCADKSDSVVKYTLPEGNNQIYASKYKLYMPTEEELKRELAKEQEILEKREGGGVMKKIGIFKAMFLCRKYKNTSETQKAIIRNERLHEIVSYAKENSPYYKELYRNIGDKFELTDLPPTNKKELMLHFDNWVTDRSIKLSDINEFMKNLDNIGRKFKGDYLVFTTSGSTGNPLVTLCDRNTNNIMGGISATRAFARKQDLKAFMKTGNKTMGIFATGGFYLGNSSIRSRLLAMPWKKKQMAVTSALLPISQIVDELNAFQPAMLGGYPTILELLIDEQKSGRLHINPVIIMTGGEYLSSHLREKLSEAFQCFVQTNYSCTEGGTIACECIERHFHINDDWVIVEPVDKDNKPVPDGVQSDKILLTNLYNYTQPFIRYEVTDRVVIHHEPCACGNPSPWLTLEGRIDDIITFLEDGKEIKIAPLAICAVLKEIPEIQRFQIRAYKDNKMELRINQANEYSKEEVFDSACLTLRRFLASHGIHHVEISLSKEEPKQHPQSGKFKHVINVG